MFGSYVPPEHFNSLACGTNLATLAVKKHHVGKAGRTLGDVLLAPAQGWERLREVVDAQAAEKHGVLGRLALHESEPKFDSPIYDSANTRAWILVLLCPTNCPSRYPSSSLHHIPQLVSRSGGHVLFRICP